MRSVQKFRWPGHCDFLLENSGIVIACGGLLKKFCFLRSARFRPGAGRICLVCIFHLDLKYYSSCLISHSARFTRGRESSQPRTSRPCQPTRLVETWTLAGNSPSLSNRQMLTLEMPVTSSTSADFMIPRKKSREPQGFRCL